MTKDRILKIDESGYTLVEAMISVAIIGLMAGLTLQCFNAGSRMCDTGVTYSRLGTETRQGMERMTRELRNSAAGRVQVPQANVIRFQVMTNIAARTYSGWIEYSIGGATGDQLLRRDLTTNATTVIANKVRNVQFVLSGNPVVLTVTLNCQDTTGYGTPVPVNLTGLVEFRNPA